MTITRMSSRTHALDQSFLAEHLKGATRYRRIAGYFTSSLFEVAGELIEQIPEVQIVCNADIHAEDLRVAQVCEAKLLGKLNERSVEAESLLNRERYQRLASFLEKRGQVIRVAPDSACGFVHGKAGVIDLADGRKLGFIGSMNETSNGWQSHYEILWSDYSPEGVAWIEAEFEFLWKAAKPLPDAVCREINRRSHRHEVSIEEVAEPDQIAPAALIESPLYREGFSLQPWQQGFVTECLKHYQEYGVVRLLLADEVGLGKTLSMGTAALALSLLAEQKGRSKPVIIFAPATLCEQWQTEMMDKLGVPCARWQTQQKTWLDEHGRAISPEGAEHVASCPLRIGIISTGLMLRDSLEKEHLLGLRGGIGLVILDEAHKARTRQGMGKDAGTPNELLAFIRDIAARSDHVLLGTATPIQTRREDLWDLVRVLHQGKGNFVLGGDLSEWHRPKDIIPILSGEADVTDVGYAWRLLRVPLPTVNSTQDGQARRLYSIIRQDLGLPQSEWLAGTFAGLSGDAREELEDALERRVAGASFFQRENPFVRHVVLRKRTTLEKEGLLKAIGVDVHPDAGLVKDVHRFNALFEGLALRASEDFREAYNQARSFGKALARSGRGSGFMKNLMEQRICSSIVAGVNTATKLLSGETITEESDEGEASVQIQSTDEQLALERLLDRLQRVKEDPKLKAILHYLDVEGWRELGCIIFSQYYDTARWVAESLAARYPHQAVGLYAGAGRSRLYRQGDSVAIEREALKRMVADRKLSLMIATDAACEGLNLQTLGTLINVDLPWNPTKLEQRIGRIKRFGQSRDKVDMLNLVNEQTVDEKVYDRLSERMKDRFDLFGSLPDTIKDEWIDDIEHLGELMDQYINAQKQETGFDLRYNATMRPTDNDWRNCARVLSRRDFETLMRKGW
ncbi:phospholipase D-like domain-containing anti-phage protein [Pseudomonas alabamensis]|uniref:phospholipase D-like domain-containing anti-phage protein n=1 Tax=Pseudomonas alabamensis TaxID=3064349 RepID=UPI0021D91442|nr:phospholipase D-like domain-containing anti-phage protein [Pseudomonas entomophila]